MHIKGIAIQKKMHIKGIKDLKKYVDNFLTGFEFVELLFILGQREYVRG